MIKVRVYLIASWREVHEYSNTGFGNYAHNTYFFGFLISSVTIRGMQHSMAEDIFGDLLVKIK